MKIAVIGGGITGMGLAYCLNSKHDVTLYEKENYIGGHSRTLDVDTPQGPVAVDTGFIVFNYRSYPNLSALFDHLEVPVAKSDMSFGVSINNGWLEYGTRQPINLFSQFRNVFRPAYWGMLHDISVFNRKAKSYVAKNGDVSLGRCLDELKLGAWFRNYYLLAMGGAIWSTSLRQMEQFPAHTLIRFFDNHGLLTVTDHPQWYTVQGGSREYVKRLTRSFQNKIRVNCPVQSVRRGGNSVEVTDNHGQTDHYDQVVFACHSNQILPTLDNFSAAEADILGSIAYQPNLVVLHRDRSFLPKRRSAWSSWVYLAEHQQDSAPTVSLSYWMNNLQPLGVDTPLIVTLNPARPPDPDLVYDQHMFEHPYFDEAAIRAQQRVDEIQGKDRIWFCGAWQRFGFHEDGLVSAMNVARKLGCEPPWT